MPDGPSSFGKTTPRIRKLASSRKIVFACRTIPVRLVKSGSPGHLGSFGKKDIYKKERKFI